MTDSSATLDRGRGQVSDLLAMTRPLTARSALASALLGARDGRLPVASLVVAGSLFGISPGAARTCLWRMVSNGELTTDNATYALAGRLLERRHRIDDAAHPEHAQVADWDGTWELAIVSLERRPATERLELRKAATALHLAEIREGVWTRPDNLDPQRVPTARAVLAQQCMQFRHARADISADTVSDLFPLDTWSRDAKRLIAAINAEQQAVPSGDVPNRDVPNRVVPNGDAPNTDVTTEDLTYEFTLSVAVVRHLQLDPLLPADLLPHDWPAQDLRDTYRTFNGQFQRRLYDALTPLRTSASASR